MEAIVQFLQAAWGVMPFEFLIVLGLVLALVIVTKYFAGELQKKDKKIDDMTKIIMESSRVLDKVVDNIELIRTEQEKLIKNNREVFITEIKLAAAEVKNDIRDLFLKKER